MKKNSGLIVGIMVLVLTIYTIILSILIGNISYLFSYYLEDFIVIALLIVAAILGINYKIKEMFIMGFAPFSYGLVKCPFKMSLLYHSYMNGLYYIVFFICSIIFIALFISDRLENKENGKGIYTISYLGLFITSGVALSDGLAIFSVVGFPSYTAYFLEYFLFAVLGFTMLGFIMPQLFMDFRKKWLNISILCCSSLLLLINIIYVFKDLRSLQHFTNVISFIVSIISVALLVPALFIKQEEQVNTNSEKEASFNDNYNENAHSSNYDFHEGNDSSNYSYQKTDSPFYDKMEELYRIKELYDNGTITREQYEKLKNDLI